MSDAPWWNPEGGSTGNNNVIRHANDLHSYHSPDPEQSRLIGGGYVGRFATIPAARHDGTSYGFDPTVAGPVIVDPDAPDGGVVFDPRRVNKAQLNAVVAQSQFPHQPFYRLGQSVRGGGSQMPLSPLSPEPTPAVPPVSAVRPTPLPSQAPNMQQYSPQPMQQQPQQYQPQPMPQPQQYQPQPMPQPQWQPPPAISAADVQQMISTANAQMMEQLRTMLQPPIAAAPPVVPYNGTSATSSWGEGERLRPIRATRDEYEQQLRQPQQSPPPSFVASARQNAEEDVRQPQSLKEYIDEPQASAVITGFETLQLPYVDGPVAKKPKVRVVFNYAEMGRVSTQYHDVIVQSRCIVLVYDTRYIDGQQYVPIEDAKRTIKIELNKINKKYEVSSMGLSYSMGVFDIVVLARADADTETKEDDDE